MSASDFVAALPQSGTIAPTGIGAAVWARVTLYMSKLQKALKTGVVGGILGLGVYTVARKLNLGDRAAQFAHSVEAVPFPGANLYAFLTAKLMRSLYREIAEEIVSAGQVSHFLDIGTGVGYLPIEVAMRNRKVLACGVDRSKDMVQIAQTNARASHLGKSVEFGTGEPSRLPFPGRYFNLVASVVAMHHWSQPLAVLDEVYHVLQPQGEFWIYDYRKEVPLEVWESVEAQLPPYLRIPYRVGPMASWKAAFSEEKLRELVSQTHFELVSLEQRTLTIFGQSMPVFNRLVLRKAELPHDIA